MRAGYAEESGHFIRWNICNKFCPVELRGEVGLDGEILKNILPPIKLQISRNLDYELVVIGVV